MAATVRHRHRVGNGDGQGHGVSWWRLPVPSAHFLSPLSFFSFLFLFCTYFYSLFSSLLGLGHFIIIFCVAFVLHHRRCDDDDDDVCQFLRRLAMLKRHPHPQCLPVLSVHSLSVLAIALASQNRCSWSWSWRWITSEKRADTDTKSYSGVCRLQCTIHTHIIFVYSVISSFGSTVLDSVFFLFFLLFPFSIFQLFTQHTHFVFGIFLRKTMQNFSLLRIPCGICTYIYINICMYMYFSYSVNHNLDTRTGTGRGTLKSLCVDRTAPCVLWRLVLTVLIRNPRKLTGKTLLKVMEDTRRG